MRSWQLGITARVDIPLGAGVVSQRISTGSCVGVIWGLPGSILVRGMDRDLLEIADIIL